MSVLKKITKSFKKIGGTIKQAGDALVNACQDAWAELRPLVAVAAFVVGVILLFVPGGEWAGLELIQWGIILITAALFIDPNAVLGLVNFLIESIAGLVGALIGAIGKTLGSVASSALLPVALVATAGFVGYKLFINKGGKDA